MSSSYLRIVSYSFPFFITFVFFSNIIRTSGDTKTPLISNVFTNILNVIGNFFLIFPSRVIHIAGQPIELWGADLGVEGAAIATLISRNRQRTDPPHRDAVSGECHQNSLQRLPIVISKRLTSRQVFTIALPMAAERAYSNRQDRSSSLVLPLLWEQHP